MEHMTSTFHYISYYACKLHILAQCSCLEPKKLTIISSTKCPECEKLASAALGGPVSDDSDE